MSYLVSFMLGCCCVALSLFGQSGDLFVMSNDPENIQAPGTVFQHSFTQQPLRLMYYHKNGLDTPLYIRIVLRNTSHQTVTVSMTDALSGPDPDGVYVGHRSAKEFLTALTQDHSTTLSIQDGDSHVVVYHLMKPEMVSTGMLRFQTDAPGLDLHMSVVDPLYGHISALNRYDEQGFQVEWVQEAEKQLEQHISLDQAVTDMDLGKEGDYGIVHRYKVHLHNPTDTYKQVRLLLSPLAGIARASVMIDGELFDVAMVSPESHHHTHEVTQFVVGPQTSIPVSLLTMPEAGSFYPVRLVFQSQDHGMMVRK